MYTMYSDDLSNSSHDVNNINAIINILININILPLVVTGYVNLI